MVDYRANVLRIFDAATPAEYDEGMEWYPSVNTMANVLSPNNVWIGAGVIAAYSINTNWDYNIILASSTLLNGIPAPGLPLSMEKAQAILNGAPVLETLNGSKVKAFASAIVDPANSTIATIDRHARDIAFGYVVGTKKSIPIRLFNELSDVYNGVAKEVGISVAQMQAITWVVWRNNGKEKNARNLLDSGPTRAH